MGSNPSPDPAGRAQLGLWDAVSLIIGIVIGAGIYETPPLVFRNVSGPGAGLAVWALAGLLSLVGALCYAELASTYPRSGGDYVYLTRTFGPAVGFLFGWAQLAVILPASIGMMAFVFADYAVKFAGSAFNLPDVGPRSRCLCAAAAVLVLSALNLGGVVLGKRTQNLLTAAKVIGLTGILAAGFLWGRGGEVSTAPSPTPAAAASASTGKAVPAKAAPAANPTPTDAGSFAFAMVLVFLTFGGWNDAAFVAAEVRHGGRNIPLALILGTLAITAIYLLVNAAYLWALGFKEAQDSRAIAADVLERAFGAHGAQAISLLVMISALGAVNGLIFTGSRVYSSLGADHRAFSWLGHWDPRLHSPVIALLTQALISLAMIAFVGAPEGRALIDRLLTTVGLPSVAWGGPGGFEPLLRCTAPVFWFFFLLTGLSLFVLRTWDSQTPRPFAVPLYPLIPLLFCSTCAYMLSSGMQYAGPLGFIGLGLLVAGLPLFFLSRQAPTPAVAQAAGWSAASPPGPGFPDGVQTQPGSESSIRARPLPTGGPLPEAPRGLAGQGPDPLADSP